MSTIKYWYLPSGAREATNNGLTAKRCESQYHLLWELVSLVIDGHYRGFQKRQWPSNCWHMNKIDGTFTRLHVSGIDKEKLFLNLWIIILSDIIKSNVYGLDWIGFTFGYGVSTALRTVLWPTPFLTRPKASRSGWLFQSTIPSKVTIAEKA